MVTATFPVIQSLLGFTGVQITAGWAFHIKGQWRSKSRAESDPGHAASCSRYRHITWRFLPAHINLSPGLYQCVLLHMVQCISAGGCVWVCLIRGSDWRTRGHSTVLSWFDHDLMLQSVFLEVQCWDLLRYDTTSVYNLLWLFLCFSP